MDNPETGNIGHKPQYKYKQNKKHNTENYNSEKNTKKKRVNPGAQEG